MKKKLFALLLVIALCLPSLPVFAAGTETIPGNEPITSETAKYPADGPDITGNTAIVMDIDTGAILYQLNPHLKAEPASTTKLMTAMLAVDNLSLGDTITVSESVNANLIEDAVSIWLSPGEKLTGQDLLYALLLPSANDAANALGAAVSGTLSEFVKLMNETAANLGCTDTHFNNTNGLPDPDHYTSVYDMALIARAAYGRTKIKDIVNTWTYTIPATDYHDAREMWSTNEMLYPESGLYYEYCTGGKTGYTGDAGYTMVSFGVMGDKRIVSVIFGCPTSDDRFLDSAKLLEFGLMSYHKIKPLEGYSIENEAEDSAAVRDNFYSTLTHEVPQLTLDTNLSIYTRSSVTAEDIGKQFVFYSAPQNGALGEVRITYKNAAVASVPVYTTQQMDGNELQLSFNPVTSDDTEKASGKVAQISDALLSNWKGILIGVALAILFFLSLIYIKNHRARREVRVKRYSGTGDIHQRSASGHEIPSPRPRAETRTTEGYEDEIPSLRRKRTDQPERPTVAPVAPVTKKKRETPTERREAEKAYAKRFRASIDDTFVSGGKTSSGSKKKPGGSTGSSAGSKSERPKVADRPTLKADPGRKNREVPRREETEKKRPAEVFVKPAQQITGSETAEKKNPESSLIDIEDEG